MNYFIIIEDLKILSSVGVYESERKVKQYLIFNLEIEVKCKNSTSMKDNLKDKVDYSQFRRIILDIVKKKHYNTIEKLHYEISKEFKKIKNVLKFKIKISKPDIFDDCVVSVKMYSNT